MFVLTPTGEEIWVNIQPSDTIRDVKNKILQTRGIPVDQQLLVAYDVELEDNRTVTDCNLDDNTTIYLMSMNLDSDDTNEIRRITVRTEDGGRIELDVDPSMTIDGVKRKIRDQYGIPLDEQYLAIDGGEVDDHRTLRHYDVRNDTVVHLIKMGDSSIPAVPSTTASAATPGHSSFTRPLSAFYVACRDNDVPKLRELLRTLPVEEMNKLEPNGSTSLHVACFKGHKEIVELLLKHGVSRSIMNRYKCLPYDEAASNEIKTLFERIPGRDRYVANSGRIEWLLVASNTQAISARNMEAAKQKGIQQFEQSVRQIIDNYIKPHFRADDKYDLLLNFFNTALRENDPSYLLKAYTAETNFYTKLNIDLASDNDAGKVERQLYVGILASHSFFDPYRYSGEAHRGMRLSDADLQEYAVGQKVMTKSFVSATMERGEAEYFVGRYNRNNIHGQAVKMGTVCTYIIRDRQNSLNVSRLSEYPAEREVLIFPYTVFTVTNIQRTSQSNESVRINITLTQN